MSQNPTPSILKRTDSPFVTPKFPNLAFLGAQLLQSWFRQTTCVTQVLKENHKRPAIANIQFLNESPCQLLAIAADRVNDVALKRLSQRILAAYRLRSPFKLIYILTKLKSTVPGRNRSLGAP